MGRTSIAICVALVCTGTRVEAVDLTKIDRTIDKLPELRSESPEYCLLVFGPEAAKRVWLVHDGDVLYVDRNGNGDLTDPNERVAADSKASKPDENVFYFRAGDIPDEPASHKDLTVGWFKADNAILAALKSLRSCSVRVDVAIPGQQGRGVGGRVSQSASLTDHRGWLQFAARPEDAPIIHFGGPWEVTLTEKERWRVGRTKEVDLVFGTPGLGPGTTACVAYGGVIPPAVTAKLKVRYPPMSPSEEPRTASYELTRRCCTYNLYGDVRVPNDVGAGTAKIEISLDSWPGGYVAPTVHDVTIRPAKPGPKIEPVSARLVSKLEHEQRTGRIGSLQFSPDGKRLIGGTYPGGVINVWDLAGGERLLSFDAGEGYRGSYNYFAVTPDWQTILIPRQKKGKFTKIERDGKTLHRVEYNDLTHVYDLGTGELLRTMQDSPPRGIRALTMAPDGSFFFTQDDLPAEFESTRPRALSVWDVESGEHREIATGNANPGGFSADGKLVAITMADGGDHGFSASIKILSVPELAEVCTISIPFERAYASGTFVAGGKVLIVAMTYFPQPEDFQVYRSQLTFCEVPSGKELFSMSPPAKGEQFAYVKGSPDGKHVVVTTYDRKRSRGRVLLCDVAKQSADTILAVDGMPRQPLFHPDGGWFVVPLQRMPGSFVGREPAVEELPQPSLACIDVASGEIIETALAPQAYLTSMAFSPDGKTLATSGDGEVLLWDFRTPPGQSEAVAAQ